MLDIQKSIKVKNGKPLVSSRDIAKVFEKPTRTVMRDIRETLKKVSPEFAERNFVLSAYKAGKPVRKYDEYLLTRDGFVILAMGYTGEKAMKFKEAYINAFNNMESFIKTRMKSRMEYPEMAAAIHDAHEDPQFYHYSTEADMINRIITGMTAKQLRIHRHIPDKDSTRDHLSPEEIYYIEKLQKYNTILLEQDHDYQGRKSALQYYFKKLSRRALAS
jgi:Rha family phage regulatory protein